MHVVGRVARSVAVVILLAVIGLLSGWLYSGSVAPVFQSHALVVLTPLETGTGVAANDYTQARAQVYAEYASSSDFGAAVRRRAGSDPDGQYPETTVSVVSDSAALTITVQALSPQAAQQGAEAAVQLLSERVRSIEGVPGPQPLLLQVIATPALPHVASTPGRSTYALAGAAAGALLGVALVVALKRLDKRVTSIAQLARAWPEIPVALALTRPVRFAGRVLGAARRDRQLDAFVCRELTTETETAGQLLMVTAPGVRGTRSCFARDLVDTVARRTSQVAVVETGTSLAPDKESVLAARRDAPIAITEAGLVVSGEWEHGVTVWALRAGEPSAAPARIAGVAHELRSRFGITIVLAETLSEDPVAQNWARVVESVLIVVRLGRTTMPELERCLNLVAELGGQPVIAAEGWVSRGDPEFYYPGAKVRPPDSSARR